MTSLYTEGKTLKAIHFGRVLSRVRDLVEQGGQDSEEGLAVAEEWPHIESGYAWAVDRSSEDPRMARLCIEYAIGAASIVRSRLHPKRRIEWLTAALSATRQLEDGSSETSALFNLGEAHADLSDYKTALTYLDKALQLADQRRDQKAKAKIIEQLAWVLHNSGDNQKAIELCQEAIDISALVCDSGVIGKAYNCMGLASLDLGNSSDALTHFNRALSMARETKNRVLESSALSNIGLAYFDQNEYRAAIDCYEQSLCIARMYRNTSNEANIVMNIGIAKLEMGAAWAAIVVFEQAVMLMQKKGNRRGEGRALNNTGRAHLELKKYSEASRYFDAALEIAMSVGDRLQQGVALRNIGQACADLDQTDQAIAFYARALVIQRDIGDRKGVIRTLRVMGDVYENIGAGDEAIKSYDAALAVAQEIHATYFISAAFYDLILAHKRFGRLEEAIEYCGRRIDFLRVIGDQTAEGSTQNRKGDCYEELGVLNLARECYESAVLCGQVSGDRKLEARALYNLGLLSRTSGNKEEAISFFRRERSILWEVGDGLGAAKTHTLIGNMYRDERRFDEAVMEYNAAVRSDPSYEQAYGALATLHQMRRDHHKAIECLQKAIALNPENKSLRVSLIGSLRQFEKEAAANAQIALVRPRLHEDDTYSQGCFFAVVGDHDQALRLLRLALENGEQDVEWVRIDPDWQTVNRDERFTSLIDEFRSKAFVKGEFDNPR